MKITCHMITSLDGRLLPERWGDPADGTIDQLVEAHYETTAATHEEAAVPVVGEEELGLAVELFKEKGKELLS